jgi:hypothetical protein
MDQYHLCKTRPIVSIDTVCIGPSINRLQIYCSFCQRKKLNFWSLTSAVQKICLIFAIFCRFFAMATKKHPNYTSFICKSTDANRQPIFVLICRPKWDFMQKTACQNV